MQRFGRQNVNESQTLLRSAQNQFHTTLPSISKRRSSKILVFVRSELLERFVYILTADYRYSRWNRENLWQQVPRPISRKPKCFSGSLFTFLKSTSNWEWFEKKDQSHSLSNTEIIHCETGSYLNVQKSIFHGTLWQKTC